MRLGHDVRGEVGGLAEELDHALHGLDDQEEEEHGEGHTEDRPLDYAVEEDLAKICKCMERVNIKIIDDIFVE